MRLSLASCRRARPFVKSSPRSPLISAHLFTTNFVTSAGISSRVSPHLFSTFPQPHPSIARTPSVSTIPPPAVFSLAPIVRPPFSSLSHRSPPTVCSIRPIARHPFPQSGRAPVLSSLKQTVGPPGRIHGVGCHSSSIAGINRGMELPGIAAAGLESGV
jgi:hypothetical protein